MASINGPSNGIPKTIKNGWFSEVDSMLPGQKFSLALEVGNDDDSSTSLLLQEFSEKSILYHNRSKYQSILVLK
jgi:hypothetical protein